MTSPSPRTRRGKSKKVAVPVVEEEEEAGAVAEAVVALVAEAEAEAAEEGSRLCWTHAKGHKSRVSIGGLLFRKVPIHVDGVTRATSKIFLGTEERQAVLAFTSGSENPALATMWTLDSLLKLLPVRAQAVYSAARYLERSMSAMP